MNGYDVLALIALAILAIAIHNHHWQQQRRQQRLAQRRDQRIDAYGYHLDRAPDTIPDWMTRSTA